MEGNKYFDNILDDDEKIIKTITPHKGKVYLANCVKIGLPYILILAAVLLMTLIPDEQNPTITTSQIVTLSVFCGAMVLILACVIIFTALYLKHTVYAVTNKRLIIRTGVFGVDFKSLDYKNLGASDVYVSLLDKILHKNTGTLRFGSASSPMNTNSFYCFGNVVAPYELYKEIKQYIASFQKEEK